MTPATATILPMPPQQIAAYDQFRGQLEELKELNRTLVFNYEDAEGNKAARSHVRKLRSTKSAVDKARATEKAASLDYGRRVDAEAKQIIGEIEKMISVHQEPLDQIEARERKRIEDIQRRISYIAGFQLCRGHDSKETTAALEMLRAMKIDDSFGEFQLEAMKQRDLAIRAQEEQYALAQQQERDAAELARLRAEQASAAAPANQPLTTAETVVATVPAAARPAAPVPNDALVHDRIVAALIERGASQDVAESLLLAIRHGKIPHLQIVY